MHLPLTHTLGEISARVAVIWFQDHGQRHCLTMNPVESYVGELYVDLRGVWTGTMSVRFVLFKTS